MFSIEHSILTSLLALIFMEHTASAQRRRYKRPDTSSKPSSPAPEFDFSRSESEPDYSKCQIPRSIGCYDVHEIN